MFRLVYFFLILTLSAPVIAAESLPGEHVLNGRIIRSLAVEANDADHILVGQKAGKRGSALVFQSLDGGKNWRTLNGNKPLARQASDVQAVAVFSKTVLLAGTWKHGLYISRDSGAKFTKIANFPSSDIRDLQVADGIIYAATGGQGIFKSADKGASWQALGTVREFFWSITASHRELFANSLGQGVYKWREGVWNKVFDKDKAYASATTPDGMAIAAETGVFLFINKKWRKVLAGEKFADVIFTANDQVMAASWSNGIAVLSEDGRLQRRLLKGKTVIHLQIARNRLLAGTWGDGLHIIDLAQAGSIPLIAATLQNDAARVRELLDGGAKADAYDANRNTALIYAARDGRIEIAEMLLKAGASPGWIDGEKVTPLILAAHKNHIKLVKLLLAAKVSRTHRDKWGRTALDYAKRRSLDDPIYRLLN